MLGSGERCSSLPWFWSDQYELSLQMAGHPERARHAIERAVGDGRPAVLPPRRDGRIVGVRGLGPASWAKEFKVARLMAESGLAPELTALRDPATRLKAVLR
jgi:3-phenylpropionate/trans-cinnamate dioxygenase ferredoxin reductase subunit